MTFSPENIPFRQEGAFSANRDRYCPQTTNYLPTHASEYKPQVYPHPYPTSFAPPSARISEIKSESESDDGTGLCATFRSLVHYDRPIGIPDSVVSNKPGLSNFQQGILSISDTQSNLSVHAGSEWPGTYRPQLGPRIGSDISTIRFELLGSSDETQSMKAYSTTPCMSSMGEVEDYVGARSSSGKCDMDVDVEG